MAANEYEWLKRADDGRWTNARKRDALMAAAEAGDAEAKARAIEWRMADEATAVRLAEVKRSVAAAGRELGDAAAGRNADRVLAAAGSDGVMRTALGRTLADSGPDAVERRLRHRLMEVSRRLADCRRRVADKAAGTVRLQHALVEARGRAVGHHVVVGCDSAAKEDVIRLGDLEARRARDLISENVAMMDALNEQLAADVRTQAAAIVKVLACGLSAQQDAAVYQQRLCRARQQHTDTARRENAREKAILAKTAKLEYTRNKIALEEEELVDSVKIFENKLLSSMSDVDMGSQTSQLLPDADVVPFVDWINEEQLKNLMYRRKDSTESVDGIDSVDTITSNSSLMTDSHVLKTDIKYLQSEERYTFPRNKVNVLKSGKLEFTRAMEAVEYVCGALGFDNGQDVLYYFSALKRVNRRIRNMIGVRQTLSEIAESRSALASETGALTAHCVPESVTRSDADIERVNREGSDAQTKRLDEVNGKIAEYGALFNEMWFSLDNLAGKLDRCQVPVARKYRTSKRAEGSYVAELRGLCLRDDAIDAESAAAEPKVVADVGSDGDKRDDGGGGGSGHPAAEACLRTLATLRAKVKACVAHVGAELDADDEQLSAAARAHFEYSQQAWAQQALLARRTGQSERRVDAATADAATVDAATAAAAAGILTREQTKRQADDIVRWQLTPKDSDLAKCTRKPISFRKRLIAVRSAKKRRANTSRDVRPTDLMYVFFPPFR